MDIWPETDLPQIWNFGRCFERFPFQPDGTARNCALFFLSFPLFRFQPQNSFVHHFKLGKWAQATTASLLWHSKLYFLYGTILKLLLFYHSWFCYTLTWWGWVMPLNKVGEEVAVELRYTVIGKFSVSRNYDYSMQQHYYFLFSIRVFA